MRGVDALPRVSRRGAPASAGYVYIVRLARAIGNTRKRHGWAQFYVGHAFDPDARLAQHRAGRGSAMLAAAAARGIAFTIVFAVPGTRRDERRIKNYKATARWLEHARGQRRLAL